ncbi:hypothetical protein C4556_00395 [Candidatus Parcubacteria bacterium]|nr:MAG: hypothetical protein C4556_00395 [Candidatus Parcubacteria bacterium]
MAGELLSTTSPFFQPVFSPALHRSTGGRCQRLPTSHLSSSAKEQKELAGELSVRFQNKKPALITQQNCVIRADFFRGATLIYLFASSVETTLAISVTGAPGLSLAR